MRKPLALGATLQWGDRVCTGRGRRRREAPGVGRGCVDAQSGPSKGWIGSPPWLRRAQALAHVLNNYIRLAAICKRSSGPRGKKRSPRPRSGLRRPQLVHLLNNCIYSITTVAGHPSSDGPSGNPPLLPALKPPSFIYSITAFT
jgi:hypothetical protein